MVICTPLGSFGDDPGVTNTKVIRPNPRSQGNATTNYVEWLHFYDIIFTIEVDGGIDEHTAARTARAGANVAVAGAAVYRSGDIRAAIGAIRKALEQNYSAQT